MALPADIVAQVASRLAGYAGLELPAWVVETRASARIDALGMEPAEYVAWIEAGRGAAELDELVEAVRVGESRLFRHRSQIAALVDAVIPALRASGRRAIRAWSAGCSAGQEPYTLAAVLSRALPGCAISVIGTDVSEDALEAARAASYPAAALDDVPEAWRDAFALDGDRLRVRPEIAGLVRFERANLVDGFAPRGCDLVWCRNVLIYFTQAARRHALGRLVAATNPGGYLFVGYSESLRDVPELEAARAGDAVYYVRRDPDSAAAVAAPARAAAFDLRTPPGGLPVALPVAPPSAISLGAIPLEAHADHTPPPMRIPTAPPPEDVLALRGHPSARAVVADLTARLGLSGLQRLVVDLDGCELLGDDLAPVFRRARAAAEAAGIALVLRTTRGGARRWLARHELEDPA